LNKDRFDVHLALLHDGHVAEVAENYGIKPFIVGSNFPGDLRSIFRLNRYIRQSQIDILHTHTLNGNLYGRMAAMLLPRPVIVTAVHTYMSRVLTDVFKNALWRNFIIWQNRLTDKLASVLITPSNALKKNLASDGINPEKIRVVYNGIDIPPKNNSSQMAASIRKEFGIPLDTFLVGTAGRMVPIKKLETLIEMAAQIIHDGLRFHVLVIGDGPQRGHLENVAQSLGVSKHIIFPGWRSDVFRILQGIDLYAHPSLSESFGYAIIEAMSAAKPVIAFETGSLSEVIVNNGTGLLIPHGDITAFKKTIVALSSDPLRARQLGQAGRNRVAEYFSAIGMTKKIEEIYESLVQQS
jgi:glycosyltransferase involved in cell wall biosynthesis